MKFLFIEPFSIGSHALFAQGFAAHSTHSMDLVEMPGKNFRWRMLGSALYLANHIEAIDTYDGIILTDLFNLADFKALTGPKCPPVAVYFHENQLTYPPPAGDRSVFQLGMINITTALAADKVLFNSHTHKTAFLKAIPEFLKKGQDFIPIGIAGKIRRKSRVLYPGISFPPVPAADAQIKTDPPLIIWNHRWGFDKNFKTFYQALKAIEKQGIDFRLALMGENFGMIPDEFIRAQNRFKDKIVQFGYVPSRSDYINLLKQGSIAVSTAIQENFGMSVIEAVLAGCVPLLPDRLSYPEILPQAFHDAFLYRNKYDFIEKLARIIIDIEAYQTAQKQLAAEMKKFLWENVISDYDRMLRELAKK